MPEKEKEGSPLIPSARGGMTRTTRVGGWALLTQGNPAGCVAHHALWNSFRFCRVGGPLANHKVTHEKEGGLLACCRTTGKRENELWVSQLGLVEHVVLWSHDRETRERIVGVRRRTIRPGPSPVARPGNARTNCGCSSQASATRVARPGNARTNCGKRGRKELWDAIYVARPGNARTNCGLGESTEHS
jgi:hypothetical protein